MNKIKQIIRECLNESKDYSNATLYHGTYNLNFKDFDLNKSGIIKYSDWGSGIYFTRSKSQADSYRIAAVKKLNKDYNEAYNEYLKVEKKWEETKYGSEEYNHLQSLMSKKVKEFQQVAQNLETTKDGRIITAKIKSNAKIYKFNSVDGLTDPFLSKQVKDKGYDIILIDENRFTEEFVVLNPDAITITGEIKFN